MTKTLNARIIVRNNTSANWTSTNPVLMAGEMGIEKDTKKFKFGDGVKTWAQLDYASANPALLRSVNPTAADSSYDVGVVWVNTASKKGFLLTDNTAEAAVWKQIVTSDDIVTLGDMTKANFATIDPANGYVDKAKLADEATAAVKLKTARTIAITGDGTGSGSFDGSGNVSIAMVLANIVAAGTGCKITVNAKGQVTGIAALAVSDIPALTAAKITDLGTAATKNTGTGIGNVVIVGADGKIDGSLMPSIAITDVFEEASQTAMLALSTANVGDVCIRSDINKTFILKQAPYSTLANWIELKTPTDTVLSVNGQTGAITLTTANIAEGTNLYWTEARGTANFNTNFALKSSKGLTDTGEIVYTTDALILDGGN